MGWTIQQDNINQLVVNYRKYDKELRQFVGATSTVEMGTSTNWKPDVTFNINQLTSLTAGEINHSFISGIGLREFNDAMSGMRVFISTINKELWKSNKALTSDSSN